MSVKNTYVNQIHIGRYDQRHNQMDLCFKNPLWGCKKSEHHNISSLHQWHRWTFSTIPLLVRWRLKQNLKCHKSKWNESLPIALFGFRSAMKSNLHCTTSEMVYDAPIRLLSEFLNSLSVDVTPHINPPPLREAAKFQTHAYSALN